jgi:hypothetical protein
VLLLPDLSHGLSCVKSTDTCGVRPYALEHFVEKVFCDLAAVDVSPADEQDAHSHAPYLMSENIKSTAGARVSLKIKKKKRFSLEVYAKLRQNKCT